MKKNITLLLLFYSFFGFSQTKYTYNDWQLYLEQGTKNIEEGNPKIALMNIELAFEIANRIFPKNRIELGTTANKLAELYLQEKREIEALPLLLTYKSVLEKVNMKDSLNYSICLNDLGVTYLLLKNYDNAINYLFISLNLTEKQLGRCHSYYALRIKNISVAYSRKGDFNKELFYLLKLKEIYKDCLGIQSLKYGLLLNSIGIVLRNLEQYERASIYYLESQAIIKTKLGSNIENYGRILNNLGDVNKLLGKYDKAISYFEESLEIHKKVNQKELYIVLNNLGSLYSEMKLYDEATKYLYESVEFLRKRKRTQTSEYVTTLQNLSIALKGDLNFKEALLSIEEATRISKKIHGNKNFIYALGLNDLASMYQDLDSISKAENIYKEAIQILNYSNRKRSSTYALLLNNLATLYSDQNEYSKAICLLEESVQTTKKILGKGNKFYAFRLIDLAECYSDNGNFKKAIPLFKKASKVLNHRIDNGYDFLNEEQQQQYIKQYTTCFNKIQRFGLKYKKSQIIKLSFNNELKLKGLILRNILEKKLVFKKTTDSNLILKLKRFQMLAENQSKAITYPNEKNDLDIFNESKDLEKYFLSLSVKRDKSDDESRKVKNKLNKKEIIIEFSIIRYKNVNIYVAYLLKRGWNSPKIINLFKEEMLIDYLKVNSEINVLYNFKSTNYVDSNLYNIIWKKIKPNLQSIEKIYFSPTGWLNKVAFNAIIMPNGERLSDYYNLIQYTTTKQILNNTKYYIDEKTTISLFGGINYNADSTQLSQNKANFTNNEISYTINTRDSKKEKFSKLQFTDNEVKGIASLFNSKANQLFIGNAATEEQFKLLGSYTKPSPTIIHLATHGFYFDETNVDKRSLEDQTFEDIGKKSNRFKESSNPLLRSGLVMAGANHVWQGKPPYKGLEDGILTAQEIANLNLSNTKLVVLSACESGLGDIKNNNEGVYGLQRAFKMAGVEYLLVSLWSVDDFTTQKMMRLFYINLKTGLSIEESYKSMVENIKKQYPDEPFKWASFVLIK